MKPVLLLAETGIVIRNLLLGTFADEVLRHRPLVVAVRNPHDARLLEVLDGKAIRLVQYFTDIPAPAQRWLDRLRNWQEFMYRFKITEKASDAERIQRRYDGEPRSLVGRMGTEAIFATGRLLARAGLMGKVDQLFMGVIERRPTTRRWIELMTEVDPAVVLSTTLTLCTKTTPSQDLSAVLAARALGVPCGTLIQSWDNLSSKTSVLPPELDRYWTWSDAMTDELRELYPRIPSTRITQIGSPQFDFHRAEVADDRAAFLGSLGFDPRRPVVLFGTGTPSRVPNEHLQALELAREIRAKAPHLQLLVRLHPKDDGSRWAPLAEEVRALGIVLQRTAPDIHMDRGGFVPPREFYKDQVNALVHAAVVVNSSSTLTVDASILDRPVVCIAYDVRPDPRFPEGLALMFTRSNHFAPLVASGGVALAHSTTECLEAILRYVSDPSADRDGRARIVKMVAGSTDGRAGHRLAAEVMALAVGS